VTGTEAEDYLFQVNAFCVELDAWLRKHHPELVQSLRLSR
jgi:hypothetical protein